MRKIRYKSISIDKDLLEEAKTIAERYHGEMSDTSAVDMILRRYVRKNLNFELFHDKDNVTKIKL